MTNNLKKIITSSAIAIALLGTGTVIAITNMPKTSQSNISSLTISQEVSSMDNVSSKVDNTSTEPTSSISNNTSSIASSQESSTISYTNATVSSYTTSTGIKDTVITASGSASTAQSQ